MVFDKIISGTYMILLIIAMLLFTGCSDENGKLQPSSGLDTLEMSDTEDAMDSADAMESADALESLEPAEGEVLAHPSPETGIPDNEPEVSESENGDPALSGTPGSIAADTGADAGELNEMESGHAQSPRNGVISDRPAVTIPPEVINPDYKALLNDRNQLVVIGRTIDELLEIIGEPPAMLRQGQRGSGWHKEVWILPIYREDSTGLYLYIENGKVSEFRLDTFVGLGSHSGLLEWFQ